MTFPFPNSRLISLGSILLLSIGLIHAKDDVQHGEEHHDSHGSGHIKGTSAAHPNKHSDEPEKKAHTGNQIKEPNHQKNHPESAYHKTTAQELLNDHEGLITQEPWQIIMRQAELAINRKDNKLAEGLYAQAIMLGAPEESKKRAYLQIAAIHEGKGELSKMAALYEKFIHEFEDDPRLAQIYMRLGSLYREMGAYDRAIARFYNVLNVSLKLDNPSFDDYKEVSLQAQLDIAETYFVMGKFKEAQKFYKRLLFLDLKPKAQENVMFKANYLDYMQENYPAATSGLEDFLEMYPNSDLVPESHFMLANAFNKLSQPQNAVKQVLALLNKNRKVSPSSQSLWKFWRKKTANQLANEFYERADYLSALKIYQAMAVLNSNPDWQWPTIYQMGLCFERLQMFPKARDAYNILSTAEEWKDTNFDMTPTLTSIQEMANWRLEHLQWGLETRGRVKAILEVAGETASVTELLNDSKATTTLN